MADTPGALQGKLLVAGPSLLDPNFARTVVLLLAHGEHGALGLVLNRLGLGTRVFLHGLKVVAQGNKIRIVRSTSERSHRESGAHHDATARPAARADVDRMRTPSNAERAARIRSHRHLLD